MNFPRFLHFSMVSLAKIQYFRAQSAQKQSIITLLHSIESDLPIYRLTYQQSTAVFAF
jgi:hypothetical protein